MTGRPGPSPYPLPRLGLLPGEPAGIGPELCVRLAGQPLDASLLAWADPVQLRAVAASLQARLEVRELAHGAPPPHEPGVLYVRPIPVAVPARPGQPDPRNVPPLLASIRQGIGACLAGELDGLVTGPLQKSVFNAAGVPFSGLTELLSEQAGGCDVVMMLANPELRVALVTTHLPLRDVADAVTADRLARVIRVLHPALRRDFGCADPAIAVLGLNPHAGEDGNLGREEIEVITPTLDTLRADGMRLIGPLPADTAFLPRKLADFDAVLAMYHDQGLPVLKHAGFERAVNITLGLPFVRVAVDHGTALDLAGSGRADPSSLIAAAHAAVDLVRRRSAFDRAALESPGRR